MIELEEVLSPAVLVDPPPWETSLQLLDGFFDKRIWQILTRVVNRNLAKNTTCLSKPDSRKKLTTPGKLP